MDQIRHMLTVRSQQILEKLFSQKFVLGEQKKTDWRSQSAKLCILAVSDVVTQINDNNNVRLPSLGVIPSNFHCAHFGKMCISDPIP